VDTCDQRRVDNVDRRIADRFKEIGTFAIVAPGGFGEVLVVLGLKVGLDQPAKGSGLWGLRPLRLCNGADCLAFSKELGRADRCASKVNLMTG